MALVGDAGCLAAHDPRGEAWRCAFAEHLLPHVATSTLVLNSRFDAWSVLASVEPGALRGGADRMGTTGGVYTAREPARVNAEWGAWFDAALRPGLEA